MSEHSLILGVFSGLPIRLAEPFAHSLRSVGYKGRVCIFTAGYEPLELEELATLFDEVRPIDGEYPVRLPRTSAVLSGLRKTRGLRRIYPSLFGATLRAAPERRSLEWWKALEFHLEGLQSLRYLCYYRYLLEETADVDVVMISDVRDVLFQRDPFAQEVEGLELYLEDASVRIGSDAFNTRWLRDLFGKDVVAAMHGRTVSCSGTVVGTRQAMLSYLTKMVTGIVWRRRPMGSHDQGVHNALIQAGELSSAKLIENGFGRVFTLGMVESPSISKDGLFHNADGTIPAVIHQWDRHPLIANRLRAFAAAEEDRSSSQEDPRTR